MKLPLAQIEQFQIYYDELMDWNGKTNLTAITGYEEVQLKHFLDSLTVMQAFPQPMPSGLKLIDIGSGGGFPGLPLKIALSELKLTLLEATGKKADFLKYLIQRLSLNDVEVVVGRAEEAAHESAYREQFDAVVARGLARMPVLVELALPFCRLRGRLIAQKKGDIRLEVEQSAKAIKTMGGVLVEVKRINLPEFEDERVLVIVDKVSTTPPMYPRRPGMPGQRPLI